MTSGLFPSQFDEAYRLAEGVNQSLLKKGALSWKQAKYAMTHPKSPTPAMVLGTREHTCLLQPEMMMHWTVRPATYPAPEASERVKKGEIKKGDPLPWHAGAGFCKTWARDNEGAIIVNQNDLDACNGMTESIWNNPDAAALLNLKGHRECSAYCVDEDTDLLLKCRFDILPETEAIVVDVKKVVSARLFDWERACAKFGYAFQAAFYGDVRHRIKGTPTKAFFFIVVEDKAPYESCVYQIGDRSIERGRKDYIRLLWEYRACVQSGVWPGYFSGVKQFDLPRWALTDQPDQDDLIYTLTES